jgi:hypothetical protein
MEGSSQLPVTASTPSYAKRKARALIGWLSEQEGVLWAAGRDAHAAATQLEHLDTCKRARQNVDSRSPGVDQSNLFQPVPVELQSHIEALKADPESAQVLSTSGEIQIVDLRRVCAAQPHVLVEDAERRVAGIAAADMLAIALVTLPLPKREQFPVTFDPIKNTWLFASPNPNLRVIGNFSTSVGPGFAGFGFAIGQQQSYMQVAGVNGRYFLRDGYHRAYGLVAAGITHAPALVKDFNTLEDAQLPAGLLPQSAYLGEKPPLLVDYLDDAVAVDTYIPSTTKLIVIQALEVSSIA